MPPTASAAPKWEPRSVPPRPESPAGSFAPGGPESDDENEIASLLEGEETLSGSSPPLKDYIRPAIALLGAAAIGSALTLLAAVAFVALHVPQVRKWYGTYSPPTGVAEAYIALSGRDRVTLRFR